MGLKILSWNVNGLRSFKQPMKEFLDVLQADLICLQETKITRDMLTEDLALVEGYTSYFAFSRRRSGYSGVATYVKTSCTPVFATEGLCGTVAATGHRRGAVCSDSDQVLADVQEAAVCDLPGQWDRQELRELDSEGRAVITVHNIQPHPSGPNTVTPLVPLAIINVYCPRADPDRADRGLYKLQFYSALRARAAVLCGAGARVVVLGDINTSHTVLDHCDPDPMFHLNPGRKFLDALLKLNVKKFDNCETQFQGSDRSKNMRCEEAAEDINDTNYSDCVSGDDAFHLPNTYDQFRLVDTFRCLYPERKDAFTCWNTKSNARETNYGTRIDYIFCDELFFSQVRDSLVLQDVLGSDHCPVALETDATTEPAKYLPEYCTKNFPEFQGQQQNLLSYFSKVKVKSINVSVSDSDASTQQKFFNANDIPVDAAHRTSPDSTKSKQVDSVGGVFQKVIDTKSKDNCDVRNNLGINAVNNLHNSKGNRKRKLNDRSNLTSKRQQSDLLSFFSSNKKVSDNQSPTTPDRKTVNGANNVECNLSLYETEMLFLKRNPDIYKKLGMAADGSVDMDVLNDKSLQTDGLIKSEVLFNGVHDLQKSEHCTNVANETTVCQTNKQEEEISSSPDNETKTDISRSDLETSQPDKVSSDCKASEPSRHTSAVSSSQANNWAFMKQKLVVPLCTGHDEACVLRTTKKKGPNYNKRFFACNRGAGRPGQKEAQCGYFKWL